MMADILTPKIERKLWACNAWSVASSGNLYQYNDHYGVCVNIHQRKSTGRWGLGTMENTPRWGPAYDNMAMAVWKSFEWLYKDFKPCFSDTLYIRYKLAHNLIDKYGVRNIKYGVLEGDRFTLTSSSYKINYADLVYEYNQLEQECKQDSYEYKRKNNYKDGTPKNPKPDPDPADYIVSKEDSEMEITPFDNELRLAHTIKAHTKTYTEDKPLFGRLVGTFKWRKCNHRSRKDI